MPMVDFVLPVFCFAVNDFTVWGIHNSLLATQFQEVFRETVEGRWGMIAYA